jgi:gamma-glutamyltranspeptidase/glutathione hydrolase|tara:strand:- start:481 stop:2232 length:1752 start_codon:yes stop_codon:yes gene_type:complete
MKLSRALLVLIGIAIVSAPLGIWWSHSGAPHTRSKGTGEYMVSSAHPEASKAGQKILAAGGSAVDAAIAVQLVLTLVEPQSSGIGGGAYMLHWDERARLLEAYDGRETAPAGATPQLFLDEAGQPLSFFDAVVTGQSNGVPGAIAMLHLAHQEHGRLPWADLFQPAIRLAEEGFLVTPRLNKMIAWSPALPHLPWSRAYFFTEDESGNAVPLAVGTRLKNPAYAKSLRLIAERGPDVFYKGEIAEAIVAASQNAPTRPGTLSMADMAAYEPVKRDPICLAYRMYNVCGMPPSTSGGLTSLQTLGILESFDMGALRPGSLEVVHLVTEASRLAYADRDFYIGDTDFVDVPVAAMLDENYLASRARLIDLSSSIGKAEAGIPEAAGDLGSRYTPNESRSRPSTSHLSIVDGQGNVVSMTTSIEAPFGSHLMAGGFFINNQLTDFSFRPVIDGKPVANAVAPGKRPRSSMTPSMVFDAKGDFHLAIGSPGGSRIIAYVTQTLVALLDHHLPMQEAINQPRHVNRNGPLEIEEGTLIADLKAELEQLGHEVVVKEITSGLHGIRRLEGGLEGGADPRREGVVLSGRL